MTHQELEARMQETLRLIRELRQTKEQLQEDILTILESFGIDSALEGAEYNSMVDALCKTVIANINRFEKNINV